MVASHKINVARNAQKTGFSGYVRNLDDGRVEAAVSCEDERVEDFITLLQKGSERSRVDGIERLETEERFSGGFVVR